MKNIIIIAAVGPNNELGKNNDLIWRIPEDMKFFRENTVNKPIAMGINTFYSLPGMLPNRKHIILTHQELEENDDIMVFNNMDDLLNYIENTKTEVMIIGGAQIYKQFLPYADTMLLTEIEEINDDIVVLGH